ncbi:MAG: PIG-L family deacetylase [Rhodospirillales bacterium]
MIDLKGKRVLCVAAHPDDEVIGCGATLCRAVERGAEVRVLLPLKRSDPRGIAHWTQLVTQFYQAVAHLGGTAIVPDDALAEEHVEAETMGLHRLVEPWVEWCDIVFTHWPGDVHQSHRSVARAIEVATRPFRRQRIVLHYEIPTSTDQAYRDTFSPNFFVHVEDRHLKRKLEAFALYTTETAPGRDGDGLRRRLELRGAQINAAVAEAFVLSRAYA